MRCVHHDHEHEQRMESLVVVSGMARILRRSTVVKGEKGREVVAVGIG